MPAGLEISLFATASRLTLWLFLPVVKALSPKVTNPWYGVKYSSTFDFEI
jgi:hypothetical protein